MSPRRRTGRLPPVAAAPPAIAPVPPVAPSLAGWGREQVAEVPVDAGWRPVSISGISRSGSQTGQTAAAVAPPMLENYSPG